MTVQDAPRWPGTWGISASDIAVALGLPQPTAEQRAVIEAPPTPALVVAGAGSGKTETMAGRVVWLVANAHLRRDEVLGLTFTRKAAGELAERIGVRLSRVDEYARRGLLPILAGLVKRGELDPIAGANPSERARLLDRLAQEHGVQAPPQGNAAEDMLLRPRVSTYNAFADGLVREHAARIGRDPDAALLSTSASWLLARSVVVNADDEQLENRDYAVGSVVDAVGRLAADALDHRANLTEVEAFGNRFAAELEPFVRDDLQAPQDPDKAFESASALGMIARLARRYDDAKLAQGVLDFADQVAGALQIAESSPDIVRTLCAQYRVVLLDEYQDTSVIQTELLSTIFRDAPVMAVGDPNQSIYGWRGASADNLAVFGAAFSREVESGRYDLSVSWRNDQSILDAANALLAPAQTARMTVPELRARPGAGPGRISRIFELTIDQEAAAVADWFLAARRAHEATGAAPGSHSGAILFRAKKHMQAFADALDHLDIPHRILGLGGLLNTPEVTDVVSALRVVSDPTQGSSLLRLLSGPRFAVGVADLRALHDLAKTLSRRDADLMPLEAELLERIRNSAGIDEQVSIIDALDVLRTVRADYRMLDGFTEAGKARLREAGEMFARLRRQSGQPIPELLRQIEIELRLDIELAANEARGPARIASTQLRAFADEVRSFLDSSERATISALLAWLSHAEDTDELMPRPEPPEPGVVQLLTIHGSKGLEWDAAAVVRLVDEELPKKPRSNLGWLSFGALPHRFRGDHAALPELQWQTSTDTNRKELQTAIATFKEQMAVTQESEERRLAYVAVTRARTDLLLSGSWWGGQTRRRKPSRYLTEMSEALDLEAIEAPEDDENPYQAEGRTRVWPLDPLGARRAPVEAAASAVREAQRADATPTPTPELARLIAERDARQQGIRADAPTRLPASRFKDYVTDFDGTVRALARPMPERPYTQTRLGTLFHSWVENRSGLVGSGASLDDALWERDDDDPGIDDVARADAAALTRLREIFERSEWAALQPIAVEIEINFALPPMANEPGRIVICKLDAVYERDGRIEIVDWKTGRPPATTAERDERMLQLGLYRLAYHRRFDVPLDEIDVTLFYVGDDLVIRSDRAYSEEEFVQRWMAARAAR